MSHGKKLELWGLVHRKVPEDGEVHEGTYDEFPPVFMPKKGDNPGDEATPDILLAEKSLAGTTEGVDHDCFHFLYYDTEDGQWYPDSTSSPVPCGEATHSIVGKWDFNSSCVAMNATQQHSACIRARFILSPKVVVCLAPDDFRILSTAPLSAALALFVTIPGTDGNPAANRRVAMDAIVLTDAKGTLDPAATIDTPKVKIAIEAYKNRGKKDPTSPRGPQSDEVPPAVPPPPPRFKSALAPKGTKPTLPTGKAIPKTPSAKSPNNPDLAAPGKLIDYKFEAKGQTISLSGVFYESDQGELRVAWDEGSDSAWPPQWDPPVEREISVVIRNDPDLCGGADGKLPGLELPDTFDVFLPECFLQALDDGESPMTLSNTAIIHLQQESKLRPYQESPSMGKAREMVFTFLRNHADDDELSEAQLNEFRRLHWNWICRWADQQGMRESDLDAERDSRLKGRTHINKQSVTKVRDKTRQQQSQYGRSRGGGWLRGGRGGGYSGGYGGRASGGVVCDYCGKIGHIARVCRSRLAAEAPEADEHKDPNQDFHRGRGNGRRGQRRY